MTNRAIRISISKQNVTKSGTFLFINRLNIMDLSKKNMKKFTINNILRHISYQVGNPTNFWKIQILTFLINLFLFFKISAPKKYIFQKIYLILVCMPNFSKKIENLACFWGLDIICMQKAKKIGQKWNSFPDKFSVGNEFFRIFLILNDVSIF